MEEFLMFEQAGVKINNNPRKHYVLDAFHPTQAASFTHFLDTGGQAVGDSGGGEKSKSAAESVVSSVSNAGGATTAVIRLSDVEIDSLVCTVRDFLPYLGEGFVERVLVEYMYMVDDVTNALLENDLPPHLAELDQNMPKEANPRVSRGPSPVQSSVYDEDEFDVLSRDRVDISKIHKGKKVKSPGLLTQTW